MKTNRPVRVPEILTTLFQQAVSSQPSEGAVSPHTEEI